MAEADVFTDVECPHYQLWMGRKRIIPLCWIHIRFLIEMHSISENNHPNAAANPASPCVCQTREDSRADPLDSPCSQCRNAMPLSLSMILLRRSTTRAFRLELAWRSQTLPGGFVVVRPSLTPIDAVAAEHGVWGCFERSKHTPAAWYEHGVKTICWPGEQ